MTLRDSIVVKLDELIEQAESAIQELPEGLPRSRLKHIRALAGILKFTVNEQWTASQRPELEDGATRGSA
jgi:hypothetical protein